MKKLAIILGVIIILVGLAVGLFSRPPKDDITIGFVGPLTGGPALWGEGAKNTVAIAVNEINEKGGVNGRKLVVQYEDGKCAPKEAVSAAQKLVSQGVKIILGGHCSAETVAMSPLSKDGQFFMLAGITAADNAVSGSDFAYRTSAPNTLFAKNLAKLVISKYKRVASLSEATAFGANYAEDFKIAFEEGGGKIIASETFVPSTTDFRSVLMKLEASKPEAIFLSPQNPAAGAQIIKQMEERGMNIPIVANPLVLNKDVYEKSGHSKLFANTYTTIPYTNPNDPQVAKLITKYKTQYGTDVPYNLFYVLSSYDAVYMVVKAIEECDENVKCVANEFKKMDYEGVAARYTFKPNGDSNVDRWAKYSIDETGEHTEEIR